MNAGYWRHYLDAFTVRLLLLTVYPWRDIRGTKMPTAQWGARGCKAVRPSQTICPAFYLTHNFFFAFVCGRYLQTFRHRHALIMEFLVLGMAFTVVALSVSGLWKDTQ